MNVLYYQKLKLEAAAPAAHLPAGGGQRGGWHWCMAASSL